MEELTEEERKEIDKILNELNEETLEEFAWAKSEMQKAEEELVQSLNASQQALYATFYKEREYFYSIARGIYKRTF